MRYVSSLAIIVLVLLRVATAQAASNEAIKRNNFGGELVKQGRLNEAITEFQSAIQADPRYSAPQLNLAYTYDRLGRADEAMAAYKQAIVLDPKNATAHNNLGVLYSKRGLTAEAMQAFEQGLTLDPTNATLRKNLEDAKKNRNILNEREARIAEARKQAEARPKDPQSAYNVARVYASFDMPDQAFEWLGKSLQLGFDDIGFVREDPVLLGLRKDARFSRLLEGR
jgi:protein O-GlcNAc transferase